MILPYLDDWTNNVQDTLSIYTYLRTHRFKDPHSLNGYLSAKKWHTHWPQLPTTVNNYYTLRGYVDPGSLYENNFLSIDLWKWKIKCSQTLPCVSLICI